MHASSKTAVDIEGSSFFISLAEALPKKGRLMPPPEKEGSLLVVPSHQRSFSHLKSLEGV